MDQDHDTDAEAALKAAVLRGDETAWRALYRRGFAPLWAYARARSEGADAAEEVVQECWMIAVRRIGRFDPERGPFEAWLKGIAANVLRNRARGRREPPRELTPGGPEARPSDADLRERIGRAMTVLPSAWQDVLHAKYRHGLGVAEIAARTGRTAKAVESLLSRARAAFRQAFRDEDGEGTGDHGP